jgi:hypothetical protein
MDIIKVIEGPSLFLHQKITKDIRRQTAVLSDQM